MKYFLHSFFINAIYILVLGPSFLSSQSHPPSHIPSPLVLRIGEPPLPRHYIYSHEDWVWNTFLKHNFKTNTVTCCGLSKNDLCKVVY